MLTVRYTIHFIENDCIEIDEEEISENFEIYKHKLQKNKDLEGMITIAESGKEDIEVTEEFWYIALNLCFNPIIELFNDNTRCYLFQHYSSDDVIVFIPMGKYLRLFGDDIEGVSYDKTSLLVELFNCGQRLIALLEKAGTDVHFGLLLPRRDLALQKLKHLGIEI